VGQGMIVYGCNDIVRTLYTCADCIRVTDDYTKFRMTFSMGTALFGMHGSFVVNRASLERKVTYDFGKDGSFTEDAYFAFGALNQGFKFAFIDGYMEEKSPFGFMDFIKQRRRWMNGLALLSQSHEFPLRIRWMLRTFMVAWNLMPTSLPTYIVGLYVLVFVQGAQFPFGIALINGISLGTLVWAYIFGATYNFSPKTMGWPKYVAHVVMSGVGCIFFGFLECMSVCYAYATPESAKKPSFHIVQKEYDALHRRAQEQESKQ